MWFFDLFRRKATKPQDGPGGSGGYWTPATVEAAIERAGRREVLLMAEQLGWTPSNPPPIWAWGQIAAQVETRRAEACYGYGKPAADGNTVH